ncbi:MAG: tryptophan 2,3-dioxygenase [Planctomycetes bacterium]|nr:tryptophan 2,3-dioxygenase [Planctomycetota bacterium]
MPAGGTSYWEYLRIDDLLALQGGVEKDESKLSNHEVLFIVVHQVFELWFKLVLRELTTVRDLVAADHVPETSLSGAVASLRRVTVVLEQMSTHWRLMETLSPRDFLDFRDKLLPASGFQSGQFRELEILLGLDPADRMKFGGDSTWLRALEDSKGQPSASRRRVDARMAGGTSVRSALNAWLHRTPIRGSCAGDAGDDAVVAAFLDEYLASHGREIGDPETLASRQTSDEPARRRIAAQYRQEIDSARRFLLAEDVPGEERTRCRRIRAAIVFIESYRELPLLAWPREFLDAMVGVEQAMLIFRQRHARMVEREIGSRTGTGGSAGVAYLDATALRYRVFPDLWAVRTVLLRRGAVPPLPDPGFYDFRYR